MFVRDGVEPRVRRLGGTILEASAIGSSRALSGTGKIPIGIVIGGMVAIL